MKSLIRFFLYLFSLCLLPTCTSNTANTQSCADFSLLKFDCIAANESQQTLFKCHYSNDSLSYIVPADTYFDTIYNHQSVLCYHDRNHEDGITTGSHYLFSCARGICHLHIYDEQLVNRKFIMGVALYKNDTIITYAVELPDTGNMITRISNGQIWNEPPVTDTGKHHKNAGKDYNLLSNQLHLRL